MIMIDPTNSTPTRQEIRNLALSSYAHQFDIHIVDAIGAQITKIVTDALPKLSEAVRDELVDGFMHIVDAHGVSARDHLISKISASQALHPQAAANKISAIRAMHVILRDKDLSANVAHYAFAGRIDEIYKLFSPQLDGSAKILVESICRQSGNKCDSRKVVVEPAMHVADRLWGYCDDTVPHMDADPNFIRAEKLAARQTAFKQYTKNGGILIEPDVLSVFCRDNALLAANKIIDHWFGHRPDGAALTERLKSEFTKTNDDLPIETTSGTINTLLSLLTPDYDACGKGLTGVFGEMSHIVATTSDPVARAAMQSDFARTAQSLYALHQIFHNPAATSELAQYCRVNNSNPDAFPVLASLHTANAKLLNNLKLCVRANCDDNNLVRETERQLTADAKRAARQNTPEPPSEFILARLVRKLRTHAH